MTGRVADASLTLAPAVYEFGWNWSDWNRLAAATVAGHLIECGAQCTGGMFSAWRPEITLSDVGYPIAEIADDGRVAITKASGSGGRVTVETVAEQLVYEIGDPAHYLTPDVDTDFSHVRLLETGPDRMEVSQARGAAPPETLKVSLAYQDGYMASATLVVCGPDAANNARAAGKIILERLADAGVRPARTHIEVLGDRRHASRSADLRGRPALGRRASRQRGRSLAGSARSLRPRVRAAGHGRTARSHRLHRRPIEAASRSRLLAHDRFARGRHASRRSAHGRRMGATTGANK